MMQVNEIRIGNWIYYNGKLSEIDLTDFRDILEDKYEINYYKAIPLTDEILLRCGFECVNKNNKHYTINDINGFKDSHKISIFTTLNNQWNIAFSDTLSGYKYYIPTTKIKYLHQLQNLYFALTGKELTYTV